MTQPAPAGDTVGPGGAARRRFRPTLRLRLTLLNAVLIVVAGLAVLLVVWLIVHNDLSGVAQRELLGGGLVTLALLGAAGVGGAWLVAGRALQPLARVTATARRLSTETLDERIGGRGTTPGRAGQTGSAGRAGQTGSAGRAGQTGSGAADRPDDEITELASTFDSMLDRLAAAFDSQRRFVANASHELRTPLTVMRTEIDVTMSDPAADAREYRRMARVVRDASVRANDLVDALLVLARTEAQTGQGGRGLAKQKPVDLATSVTTALDPVRREAERIGVGITSQLRPAPVIGDRGLLDRLAGNLVENAVRYNHPGGGLWVQTGVTGQYAFVQVGNTGPVVDPADVPGLFEPFRRGGLERTGSRGAGLGLSIVRAVVDAHGGTVRAQALPAGGLEITVWLPAAGRPAEPRPAPWPQPTSDAQTTTFER